MRRAQRNAESCLVSTVAVQGLKSGPRRALDPVDGDIAKATRPDLGLELWGGVPVT